MHVDVHASMATCMLAHSFWLLSRAKERRADIQGVLQRGRIKQQPIARVLDLSAAEQQHKYLEGTGAFVLDRVNGIAYLNVSERADVELAQQWVQDLGYKVGLDFNGLRGSVTDWMPSSATA